MTTRHRGAGDRPNLILFNPDSWRGDALGHLGAPGVQTPYLDRLVAESAVSFRHAFCQNPVCTPSRCSFMTGWYPHTAGHRTMTHMLRRHEPVMLQVLKEQGYHVAWGGKNDLVPGRDGWSRACHERIRPRPGPDDPEYRSAARRADWRGAPGSDTFYSFFRGRIDRGPADPPAGGGHPEWRLIESAVSFLRSRAGSREPFCLYLSLTAPHPPYAVEEPFFSRIDRSLVPDPVPEPDWSRKPSLLRALHQRQGLQGWSPERWRELRAVYYGMCARVDRQFGRLVETLRETGLFGRTAVLFFSDHGDFTGDYGLVEKTQNTFEDCLCRVPLVFKPPADLAASGVRDALVELVDVPATVYELAGVEPGYTHFGRSLLPAAADPSAEHRDAVFCEGGRLAGEEAHCAERASPSFGDPGGLYHPRIEAQQRIPEHTRAAMCRTRRFKYVRRFYEPDEFYDLEQDPGERDNRAGDPARESEIRALRDRMLNWYMETCDVVPWDLDERGFSPADPGAAAGPAGTRGR